MDRSKGKGFDDLLVAQGLLSSMSLDQKMGQQGACCPRWAGDDVGRNPARTRYQIPLTFKEFLFVERNHSVLGQEHWS